MLISFMLIKKECNLLKTNKKKKKTELTWKYDVTKRSHYYQSFAECLQNLVLKSD